MYKNYIYWNIEFFCSTWMLRWPYYKMTIPAVAPSLLETPDFKPYLINGASLHRLCRFYEMMQMQVTWSMYLFYRQNDPLLISGTILNC